MILVSACLAPLFVGFALTTLVRAAFGRDRRDRDHRIARACFVLAALLATSFVLALLAWGATDAFVDALLSTGVPWLSIGPALLALAALFCITAPALSVALLAAERAKHTAGRR